MPVLTLLRLTIYGWLRHCLDSGNDPLIWLRQATHTAATFVLKAASGPPAFPYDGRRTAPPFPSKSRLRTAISAEAGERRKLRASFGSEPFQVEIPTYNRLLSPPPFTAGDLFHRPVFKKCFAYD